MARTLKQVRALMIEAGIAEAFKFTAAVTDGTSLWAYRWSCDGNPPTLYFREAAGNLLVVSEPIDDKTRGWREVPKGCSLVAQAGSPTVVRCLNETMAELAA
jgi:glutamine amidotransferase